MSKKTLKNNLKMVEAVSYHSQVKYCIVKRLFCLKVQASLSSFKSSTNSMCLKFTAYV